MKNKELYYHINATYSRCGFNKPTLLKSFNQPIFYIDIKSSNFQESHFEKIHKYLKLYYIIIEIKFFCYILI